MIKKSQLKTLIRGIVKEAKSSGLVEALTTRAELDKGVMKAVNLEATGIDDEDEPQTPRTPDEASRLLRQWLGLQGSTGWTAEDQEILNQLIAWIEERRKGGRKPKGPRRPIKEENATADEMEEAKQVASANFGSVYLTRFYNRDGEGNLYFEILLHSATGDRHFIKKDRLGSWYIREGQPGETKQWKPVKQQPNMSEMTSTGAVAGYSTPYWGSRSRKGRKSLGSGRGIKATKKLGYKVVKSISEG